MNENESPWFVLSMVATRREPLNKNDAQLLEDALNRLEDMVDDICTLGVSVSLNYDNTNLQRVLGTLEPELDMDGCGYVSGRGFE